MTSTNPLVSIGLPIYNGEKYISEAIDSILAQTYDNFELIISDNASTDRTELICREYLSKDQRIVYHKNQRNIGAAANYNQVFALSIGKYFKWAAHDDVCAPELIERCVEVLENNPSVILCFSNTVIIDENSQFIKAYSNNLQLSSKRPYERFKRYRKRLRKSNLCDPIFGIMRTRQLKTTALIGSYISSDMTLLGELALLGEFYEIPQNLFFRRHHPEMSVQANYNWRKRLSWFNPEQKGKLLFPHWSLFIGFISAINRVTLVWHEKLSCYALMGIFLLKKRKLFSKELLINLALLFQVKSFSFLKYKKELPKFW